MPKLMEVPARSGLGDHLSAKEPDQNRCLRLARLSVPASARVKNERRNKLHGALTTATGMSVEALQRALHARDLQIADLVRRLEISESRNESLAASLRDREAVRPAHNAACCPAT